MNEPVDVWKVPRTVALGAMAQIAEERLAGPDLRALVISSRGACLTLQVMEGAWAEGRDLLAYVRERGLYEVLRREEWPGGRVLLTLRAHGSAAP